ncbi:MAG: Dabb family protein [Subtercola sp.]|nr:Dabb family protein [Subtercola sp.]
MILHIVTFAWVEDADPTIVAEIPVALRAMAAQLPMLSSYSCGANLHLRPGGADFAVIAEVTTKADLDAYLDAPAHIELIERLVSKILKSRQAVQLETSLAS